MLAQARDAVQSPVQFLISAAGLPLLASGLVFSVWGLWNIFRPQRSVPILSQITLSLVPGMIAMVAIYLACNDLRQLATARVPPKPVVLAGLAGRAMSYGFVGLLSTVVPVLLGVIGIRKHCVHLLSESPDSTT